MVGTAPEGVRQRQASRRGQLIANLRPNLPWQGAHAALMFDWSSDSFVATIDASDADVSNAELDEFLRANGIDERTWFSLPGNGGLVVTNQ